MCRSRPSRNDAPPKKSNGRRTCLHGADAVQTSHGAAIGREVAQIARSQRCIDFGLVLEAVNETPVGRRRASQFRS